MSHLNRMVRRSRRGAYSRSRFLDDQKEVYEKHLEEQLNEGNTAYSKASKRASKLRDCLMTVAEKVCDNEYSEKQLGGPNQVMKLSDAELRDFIIQNFYTQRQNMTDTISKLQQSYIQAKTERDDISQRFLQTEQKLKEAEARINDLEYAIQHSAPVTALEKTSSEMSSEDVQDSQLEQSVDPIVSQEGAESVDNIVMMDGNPYDLSQIKKTMDVYQMGVLRLMGTKGCNETSDILETAMQTSDFTNDGQARNALKSLKESGIVQDMKHPVLPNGALNYLTEVGKAMFTFVYRKKPVIDEMSRIRKMHDNYDHGYYIKHTAKALEESGYSNVCMDNHQNCIEIATGKRYVPDIIAEFNGRKTFWEVERGNHHDSDFFEKMDKAAVATGGIVYIIADNKATKKHLNEQINKYAKEKRIQKSKINFEIYLGTLQELKDGRLINDMGNRHQIGPSKKKS